jgi:magnesium transporter
MKPPTCWLSCRRNASTSRLSLMEDKEAQDVRKLLAYPEDTAGGIMNTEYFIVPANLTAEQVMERLREAAPEAETIYYIYVGDAHEHLQGVFSLRQLVLAQPDALVSDFMEKRVVTVDLTDSQQECAQVISKCNLLAIPVIDQENRMHGIVTADDALDKIIPIVPGRSACRAFTNNSVTSQGLLADQNRY